MIICQECHEEIDPLEPRDNYIADNLCQACSARVVAADMGGHCGMSLNQLDWDWMPDLIG